MQITNQDDLPVGFDDKIVKYIRRIHNFLLKTVDCCFQSALLN
jgi:hypothetical protein